jgi:UDP-N-acetylmuramate dehydrogenase
MFTSNSSNSLAVACDLFHKQFGDGVLFNEPLAPYLAYNIGGPADILVFPKNENELDWVSQHSKKLRLPITIIGTGTNLLVVDEGLRGVTISLSKAFKDIVELPEQNNGHSYVRCGGGVEKPTFLDWSIQRGLGGLEFSAGVPGTIGGGIYMNAGTKYGCYGDILEELRLYDFGVGGETIARKNFHFGYREQSAVGKKLVVWSTFRLTKRPSPEIKAEVDRIIQERAEKQPLDYPSCGSTFKNPEGYSAGRLIEKAGLKGLSIGRAEISSKHANFILNKGNATAKNILDLIAVIKSTVKEQFGVTLECEVIILGNSRENQVSY